jgi:arginase family enzyme
MYKILEAPYDGSATVPGCRIGPNKIIEYALKADYGLNQDMIHFCSVINQSELISLTNIEKTFSELTFNCREKVLTIGGNHIITYPILNALSKEMNDFSLIYFDAHSDTDDLIIPTNSSFISYFLKEHPNTIITNVGLRFKEYSLAQNIHSIPSSNFVQDNISTIIESLIKRHNNKPVYISIDIDVLDPCYAPAVSSPIGGGISTMQLSTILNELMKNLDVIGIDLTEYNPLKDVQNITLPAILSILWEIHKNWG